MIAICSRFCSPEGVIDSSCGNYRSFLTGPFSPFLLAGPFWPGDSPFWAVGL